ncbi:MAG: inositol-phosphate phosphatase [Gammaproteobacteria bacterium]|nr:inositol-phosphate phosphatase [Gammaproteobacteria bacterium]
MNALESRLIKAKQAATAAAEVIRHYYDIQLAGKLEVELKSDASPVTQADIESEKVIRKILLDAFPQDGFYGEETGQQAMDSEFLWLIDPIDGTKSFVREYPFFSTQIALMQRSSNGDELVLGVSSAPQFEEIAYAIQGQDAKLNENKIQVSKIDTLEKAALSTGNLGSISQKPQWNNLGKVISRVSRNRGYGDFYHYHLLAAGKIDAVIESDLNILDIAALSVIVRAAGGRVTQLDGAPVGLQTTHLLATNGLLHEELLREINYA